MPVASALGGLDLDVGGRLGSLDVLLGGLGVLGVIGHGVGGDVGVDGEVLVLAQRG